MKQSSQQVLRNPALVFARSQWYARLQGLFDGQHQCTPVALQGICQATEQVDINWRDWMTQALDALAEQAQLSTDQQVFRPLCVNFNPRGVHCVDDLFGAEVFMLDGGWQTRALSMAVGTLQPPELDAHPSWRTLQDFARAFVASDAQGVIFGLPTIASALNIAVNLFGQDILYAMLTQPDAARHDLRVINDLLCSMHRWYAQIIPDQQRQCIVPDGRCQPPGYGQLCGCTTQLVSGDLYRRFIAPLDDALLSLYPHGGMIHLCGSHTQHIPVWREMKPLRAVQLNDRAAEDLPQYFCRLRSDQICYVNPCDAMPVERIIQITGGQRTVIVADTAIGMPAER